MKSSVLGSMVLLAAISLAWAQEGEPVEALIEKGLEAYRDGRTREATRLLQEAITLMQKEQGKGLVAFFPPVADGWEADEVESQAMSFGSEGGSASWLFVSRDYRRLEDKLEVRVTLADYPEFIQIQRAASQAFKDKNVVDVMNKMNPKTRVEVIERDGWFGWLVVEKGESVAATFYCDAVALIVEVANKDDEEVARSFLKEIDFEGLAQRQ